MPTSIPNFNFLASLVSAEGVPKFKVELLAPPRTRTPKLLCVLQVFGKFKQPAKFQHRISMHHAVMPICISHRLSIIRAQKWFFGSFEGEDVKILCSHPQKALPA